MSDMTTNWVPGDDAMVEAAIRRGASRRDLLKMMLANGIALAAGSAILAVLTGRSLRLRSRGAR